MRFGFLIDHRRCIGCHACSVACKEEHQVPLGVYRTWVKYIEKGSFPDVRRHFSVLRCNHCDNAPCVTICPTEALFRRDNGIIDFDAQHCIGCKACMQACPYDALYIDPSTQTAAKCNFCAHRVDQGLKPSCEVVCPEQAIISGDLDDPSSAISRLVHREPVTVRKPEQGTKPKLYYLDVDENSVDPGAASRGQGYQFATEQSGFGHDAFLDLVSGGKSAEALTHPDPNPHLQEAQTQARTTYDVVHHRPWGGKVSAYIFTKSVAAGVLLCYALGRLFGLLPKEGGLGHAVGLLGLLFLGITSVLLVADLKQPWRFWKILVRPQFRSWLALGAFVLMGYGALLTWFFLGHWFEGLSATEPIALYAGSFAAVFAAIYTGFLFAQAEGRDYWQNPVLTVHLFVQAMLAGSGVLVLCSMLTSADILGASGGPFLRGTLLVSLGLDLLIVLVGELGVRHGTRDAAAASRWLTHGPARGAYWWGVVLAGHLLPMVLLALGFWGPAALLGLGGLLLFEHLWILAGQSQPLS